MLNCILGPEFCHANEEKQLAFQFPHANMERIVGTENIFCHLSGSGRDKGLLQKLPNVSAGSLLNTHNKCLYSIRGTLSRSGGSKMGQFGAFHNCLRSLLFFSPSKQTQLRCFQLPSEKRRARSQARVRSLTISPSAGLSSHDQRCNNRSKHPALGCGSLH